MGYRSTNASNIVSLSNRLFAVFVTVLLLLLGTATSLNFRPDFDRTGKHVLRDLENAAPNSVPIVTIRTRFIAHCSMNYVRVKSDGEIDANAAKFDSGTEFLLDKQSHGEVFTIRSSDSTRYICFTRRGKLVSRFQRNSDRCEFFLTKQQQYGTEYRIRSKFNSSWFVGFNGRGKPLRMTSRNLTRRRTRPCFGFLKEQISGAAAATTPAPFGSFSYHQFDASNDSLQNNTGPRLRHSRRKNGHRRARRRHRRL